MQNVLKHVSDFITRIPEKIKFSAFGPWRLLYWPKLRCHSLRICLVNWCLSESWSDKLVWFCGLRLKFETNETRLWFQRKINWPNTFLSASRTSQKPNSQLDLGDSVPKSGNQKMSKSSERYLIHFLWLINWHQKKKITVIAGKHVFGIKSFKLITSVQYISGKDNAQWVANKKQHQAA